VVGPAQGLEARFGAAPAAGVANTPRVRHAARLFVDHVLAERRAEVALFWSSGRARSARCTRRRAHR
jgi:hypothetical protein